MRITIAHQTCFAVTFLSRLVWVGSFQATVWRSHLLGWERELLILADQNLSLIWNPFPAVMSALAVELE